MWCSAIGCIVTLILNLLATPLATEAQPVGKGPRIGFIGNRDPQSQTLALDAFRQGLRDLGWIEGQNLNIEYRWAEGQADRHPRLAAELVQLGVIALFPRWKTVSLGEFGCLQGAPFGGMMEVSSNHHSSLQEPLYGPYYADKGPVDNHLAAFGGATLWLTRPGCAPD